MKKNQWLSLRTVVLTSALAVSSTLLSVAAFAGAKEGGRTGGGGAAVVCRDPETKKILPGGVRLLDLYEGVHKYQFDIKPSDAPVDVQISRVFHKLAGAEGFNSKLAYANDSDTFKRILLAQLLDGISDVRKIIRPIGAEDYMRTFEDFGDIPLVVKKGCEVEQVGFYMNGEEGQDVLLTSPEILKEMTPQDVAAFYLHEAVYKIARTQGGQTDSKLSRKVVAALFAESEADVEKALESILYGQKPAFYINSDDPERSQRYWQFVRDYRRAANQLILEYDPNSLEPIVATLSLGECCSVRVIENEDQAKSKVLKNGEPMVMEIPKSGALSKLTVRKRRFIPRGPVTLVVRQGNRVLAERTLDLYHEWYFAVPVIGQIAYLTSLALNDLPENYATFKLLPKQE